VYCIWVSSQSTGHDTNSSSRPQGSTRETSWLIKGQPPSCWLFLTHSKLPIACLVALDPGNVLRWCTVKPWFLLLLSTNMYLVHKVRAFAKPVNSTAPDSLQLYITSYGIRHQHLRSTNQTPMQMHLPAPMPQHQGTRRRNRAVVMFPWYPRRDAFSRAVSPPLQFNRFATYSPPDHPEDPRNPSHYPSPIHAHRWTGRSAWS